MRTIHTDPNAWTELIIITNKWHMARVEAIFTSIFSLPTATSSHQLRPTGTETKKSTRYHLHFETVEDILSPSLLQLRESREKQSLNNFISNTAPLWNSLADVHHFMFSKHQAYSAERFTDRYIAEKIDPQLLKSY